MTNSQNSNSADKKTFSGLLSDLETMIKLSVALGGLAYLSGFLVVNIHLVRQGFQSLGFFENRYVLAGIWSLLPILVGALGTLVAYTVYQPATGEGTTRTGVDRIGLALVGLFFVIGLPYWTIRTLGVRPSPWWLVFVLVGFFSIFLGYLQAQDLFVAFRVPLLDKAELLQQIGGFIMLVLLIPVYSAFFSSLCYPDIPQNLGGGAVAQVRLAATETSQALLEGLGIQFSGQSSISDEVNLLMVTDTELMVVLGGRKVAATIKRDLVDAILFGEP